MQLDWFRSFVETIHTKSLSKAGEKLNISQTALSKQIKNLEESFGVSLFTRSTTGMELTEEGKLLYEKVQIWLKDIEETKRQMVNLGSTKHLVFGTLPSFASHFLPELILRLKVDGITADIKILNTSERVLEAFLAGDIDVGILERITSIPKIYPTADLFTEPYYVVFPDTHPLNNLTNIHLSDIAHEPLVLYPPKCDVRRSLELVLEERGQSPTVAEEVRFGEAILGFVAAGAGITVMPETIAKHLGNSNLVAAPVVDFGMMRTVCWMAKSNEQFQFLKRYMRYRKD